MSNERLTWTSSKPDKQGWYWWRLTNSYTPDIHYLVEGNKGLDELDSHGHRHPLLEDVGEWAGPIPLPEPQKGVEE